MESETLRRGKTSGKLGLDPAIVSRNLTAASELAPGAVKKFSTFMRAVREFFGLGYQRAFATQKAIHEGRLDEAKIDDFVSKLIGLDADGQSPTTAASEQRSEIEAVPALAFSLGGKDKAPGNARPAFDEDLINRAVDEAIARGNIASTDEARPLLPGYEQADPLTRETSFHKRAGELNAEVIKRLLERDPGNHLAILLAGGPGSGKTSVVRNLGIPYDLAVDTMLSRKARANSLIEQIRQSDRDAIILYVHREFASAFDANILRYLEGKAAHDPRLVPLRAAAEAHVGAQETALTLAQQGIKVIVMDNSGALGTARREDIEFLKKNQYATYHEREREARPDDGRRDDGNGSPSRGASLEEGAGRDRKQAAIDRLVAEGDAILERYRREGKLTDAEARAFRGENEGLDGSTEGSNGAPGHSPEFSRTDGSAGQSDGQADAEAADSPANVLGTTYQPVPEQNLPDWARRSLAAVEREAGGRGKVRVVQLGIEDPPGKSGALHFSAELFSLFRKRILFVKGTEKALRFDGMISPNDPNTIIIDADAPSGLTYLFGHELGHSIQHQRPELYDVFQEELLAMAGDWSDYREKLRASYRTEEQFRAEFTNDFIGNQMGDPVFWQRLHQRNPGVFRRLVDAALAFLKELGSRIGSLERDVRPYFKDIEAARASLVMMLEDYQRGPMPESSVRTRELPDHGNDNELSGKLQKGRLDKTQDARGTSKAEKEHQDRIGERLSKIRKKARHMGGAGDTMIGEKILERLMRKSIMEGGKAPVREALFGERLAMTPEEIRILESPVEILLRYTPDGRFHSERKGRRTDHDSPTMIKDGEIFCHNHPGGRGPSDGDLKFGLENPACTVRVVARNELGKTEIYQIKSIGHADAKTREDIGVDYREFCERLGDDANARRTALRLILARFGDYISIRTQQLQ